MQAHRPSHAECLAFEGAGQGASSQAWRPGGSWWWITGVRLREGFPTQKSSSHNWGFLSLPPVHRAFMMAMDISELVGELDLRCWGLVRGLLHKEHA